ILPSLTVQEHQSLQKDRPASPTVYQIFLQANEFGRQWENLPGAIEMYERCVSLDPSYAPAWARLGRARWLCDKYTVGSLEGLGAADEAFQTALRLNPNLTLAHNLYTHVQIDQGRSLEALKRLLGRAQQRRSDGELFAGLGQQELDKPWRLGKLYLTSLRTLLEGKHKESLAVSEELMQATFRDPEGMYYLGRQLAYLRHEAQALETLSRAIDNGFFCHQAMLRYP